MRSWRERTFGPGTQVTLAVGDTRTQPETGPEGLAGRLIEQMHPSKTKLRQSSNAHEQKDRSQVPITRSVARGRNA